MCVDTLCRYPVKSMLGESIAAARLGPGGLDADRGLAVIDAMTGLVATAKHPRRWRGLLKFSAALAGRRVLITSPEGRTVAADEPRAEALLSAALGRPVRLSAERPEDATIERSDPEAVLAHGVEAEVDSPAGRIGRGSPGASFVDYAPVHLITTATLDRIGGEHVRYRPNLVIRTPPGTAAFAENGWAGRELRIGAVALRVTVPTPRCAVPTLEHGRLPRSPQAVRVLLEDNRIGVLGSAPVPCAGGYAEIVRGGVVRVGDRVTLH